MSGASRQTAACVKCCLVLFAVASALCVSAPALYWRFENGVNRSSSSSCAPCICDCPPPLSLHNIAPGLINLSAIDCGKHDPELSREMEKQFVDLLTEELKLQEVVSEDNAHHMNTSIVEANRVASQYQKEAEKCNAATDICEGRREQTEAAFRKEKKATYLWERRARQLGWQDA